MCGGGEGVLEAAAVKLTPYFNWSRSDRSME